VLIQELALQDRFKYLKRSLTHGSSQDGWYIMTYKNKNIPHTTQKLGIKYHHKRDT